MPGKVLDPQRSADINALLKTAYQILEDEICPSCGTPDWLARTADNRVSFRVLKSTCYGCLAKDEVSSTAMGKPGPGESLVVKAVYLNDDDEEIPGRMLTRRVALSNISEPTQVSDS